MTEASPPVRTRLLVLVRRQPGARLTDLEDRYARWEGRAAGPGVLRHHLARLERERRLLSVRSEGERRYYLPLGPWASNPAAWAALQGRTTGTLARLVAARPGALACDLTWDLRRSNGWSRSRAYAALDRLQDLGLVALEREGRAHRCRPTDRLRRFLALLDHDLAHVPLAGGRPDGAGQGAQRSWDAHETGLARPAFVRADQGA
jgi:DNA-binding transcriptional ArsR family regulator